MHPYAAAMEIYFARLCDQAIEALAGIPEDDLAHWRPGQVHGDVATLYGMATHIAGAGEFWTLQAAGGKELNRRRLEEFAAEGSIETLRGRYDRWLAELHQLLERLTEDDLSDIYRRDANPSQGVSAAEKPVAECIVHALEHTAMHVGHLQLQRQLWDQERGEGAQVSG